MVLRKICNIVLLCIVAVSAMAVPAKRGAIIRTAADGTEKEIYLHGDAFFHYTTDAEGNWLDDATLMPLSEEVKATRLETGKQRVHAHRVQQAQQIGGELNLAPRGLLILVNFKDKAFVTPKDTMDNMLNGDNFTRSYSYKEKDGGRTYTRNISCSGSAKRYFQDQSWGQYSPIFDVVGPYTINGNVEDYGANDSSGDDKYPGKMIKEACQAADADGVDFTIYDNNNDGKVDFVYVIYAGFGEADGGGANTIWPHNWDLQSAGAQCTVDGKKVRNYACSNELQYVNKQYAGIGTFCHEFSHVLGLPDLYGNAPHTLYDWDILDYGPYNNDGNTPPAYSAYERFYMGWLQPRVLTDPEAVWLGQLNDDRMALLMCEGDSHNLVGNDPNPTTFYMLENRQKKGWDKYLPGKGLLITKIQYSASKWSGNTVNDNANDMGVDIIEAKANTSSWTKATDAYPAGATEFTDFAGHEITEIELNEQGSIIFSYRGAEKNPIENVTAGQIAQKILKDGRVVIIRNGVSYDLMGRTIGK